MRSNNETASRQNLENPSILKKDRDQVLWARETEHPTQTLVFTKTAGRHNLVEAVVISGLPKISERATLQNLWRHKVTVNSALLPANVDLSQGLFS